MAPCEQTGRSIVTVPRDPTDMSRDPAPAEPPRFHSSPFSCAKPRIGPAARQPRFPAGPNGHRPVHCQTRCPPLRPARVRRPGDAVAEPQPTRSPVTASTARVDAAAGRARRLDARHNVPKKTWPWRPTTAIPSPTTDDFEIGPKTRESQASERLSASTKYWSAASVVLAMGSNPAGRSAGHTTPARAGGVRPRGSGPWRTGSSRRAAQRP